MTRAPRPKRGELRRGRRFHLVLRLRFRSQRARRRFSSPASSSLSSFCSGEVMQNVEWIILLGLAVVVLYELGQGASAVGSGVKSAVNALQGYANTPLGQSQSSALATLQQSWSGSNLTPQAKLEQLAGVAYPDWSQEQRATFAQEMEGTSTEEAQKELDSVMAALQSPSGN